MGISRTITPSSLLSGADHTGGRVFVRWTESTFPSAAAIGVNELVIPWGTGRVQLMNAARKRGYHVYAEAKFQDAHAAADAAATNGLAGVIVEGRMGAPVQASTQKLVENLRRTHPKLSVLELNEGGKQPKIRGSMVIDEHGVLAVTSPTRKPWIDSNVALANFVRTFQPKQMPLFSFSWEFGTPVERVVGPRSVDYALAVSEAGAMRTAVILPIYPSQQKALAEGDKEAWQGWGHVRDYIKFYSKKSVKGSKSWSDIAIVTENYGDAYEPMNLLARHNILYQVLSPGEVSLQRLRDLHMVIMFSQPAKRTVRELQTFSSRGGIIILVNLRGPLPWDSHPSTKESYGKSYKIGRGEIAEFSGPVENPEEFAERIRFLRNRRDVLVRLWNASTTLAFAYTEPRPGNLTLDLVNYAQESIEVQARVKGVFSDVRYETPEHGFCPGILPTHENGFTEFVVPRLRIGGRVYLGPTRKR